MCTFSIDPRTVFVPYVYLFDRPKKRLYHMCTFQIGLSVCCIIRVHVCPLSRPTAFCTICVQFVTKNTIVVPYVYIFDRPPNRFCIICVHLGSDLTPPKNACTICVHFRPLICESRNLSSNKFRHRSDTLEIHVSETGGNPSPDFWRARILATDGQPQLLHPDGGKG